MYRPNIYLADGSLHDGLGTYKPELTTVTAGLQNAYGGVLYDSKAAMAAPMENLANAAVQGMSAAGRAAGSRARVLRVQGRIYIEPSTWAVGSIVMMGFRIGVFEQDTGSHRMSIDADYTMWTVTTANHTQCATFANMSREHIWETRFMRIFGSNDVSWTLPIDVRMKRTLRDNEGLFIYSEGETGAVSTKLQFWLRTLVQDEG